MLKEFQTSWVELNVKNLSLHLRACPAHIRDWLGIVTHSNVWIDDSARLCVCAIPVLRSDSRFGEGAHVLFPLCLASEDAPPHPADCCFPGLWHPCASGDWSSGVVLVLSVTVLCITLLNVTVTASVNSFVSCTSRMWTLPVTVMVVLGKE